MTEEGALDYTVVNELSGADWLRIAESQFLHTMEPHEAASLCFLFAHEEHGLHGFCIHTAPGDADVLIKPQWWVREPHHELDKEVIVRRDRPDDASPN